MSNTPNLLRLPAVMAKTGLSRSTIYLWMKDGRFPVSYTIGPHVVAWTESDIDEWIHSKIGAAVSISELWENSK